MKQAIGILKLSPAWSLWDEVDQRDCLDYFQAMCRGIARPVKRKVKHEKK